MRCFGRTPTFRRCRREVNSLFCRDHRLQPYAALIFLATVVGLFGGIYRDVLEPTLSPSMPQAVSPEVLNVLRSLSDEFSGKSESMLRDEFGFDEMTETNIQWLFASYRKSAFGITYDIGEYLKVGSELKILPGGGGTINMETGEFTPEPSDRHIRHLLLPPQYYKRIAQLRKYSDSPFVPQSTQIAVKQYIKRVEANTSLLGEVLETASRELPSKYPTRKAQFSSIWITSRFVRRFEYLTPAAKNIRQDIARYVENR